MLAAADVSQLLKRVQITLVGVSDAGLKTELFDVLSEFFNDSSCWTELITISANSANTSYQLTPTEGQIIRLESVLDGNSFAVPALMADVGTLILANAPNTTQSYFVTVTKNVSLPNAKEMIPIGPDWVLPLWHVGILDGMLGKLMNQPAKSYSNTEKAVYHLKRFRDAIARARVSKQRANTRGTQAWRFPGGWNSHSQQSGVPSFSSNGERTF